MFRVLSKLSFVILFLHLLSLTAPRGMAQAPPTTQSGAQLIKIDASYALAAPQSLPVSMGGVSPDGRKLGINSLYLTLDGKPWLPIMGEFHYSRYPEAYWEEELLKMKAAGVQIIATYVFWIHHEEIAGQHDWTGQRDLRHFVQLCAKHQLFVFVRIGPFAHGEVRNGGLPDWLVKAGPTRRNTPEYLEQVRSYFGEIGRQLYGLFWKDGGPIIGVQLENEYFSRGPDAGAAHILALKKIALDSGLEAPLYTVTGWDNPDFPPSEVLPVFGAYPDAFWESILEPLPPSYAYLFDFKHDLDVPPIASQTAGPAVATPVTKYPLLLAEAGGGMQVAYHRRPVISADDVAAVAITHLGAGANLYGYYMFQGGANPIGKNSTFQESAAVDQVYDLPVISYDFQAPLGQYGQLRPSYRTLKLIHYFLADFGSLLAPMAVYPPDRLPRAPDDKATPRVALRSDGHQGFLFLNNYLRDYTMTEQRAVQFQVKLSAETLTVPRKPVDVPSGSYFIWPLNLQLDGVTLRYSTAQLVCTVREKSLRYYFFFAPPGISPEFSFDARTLRSIQAPAGATHRQYGSVFVDALHPGSRVAISLTGMDSTESRIVLLSVDQAKNLWRDSGTTGGSLVLSPTEVFFDGNAIQLRTTYSEQFEFGVFPHREAELVHGAVSLRKISLNGIFDSYSATVTPQDVKISWELLSKPEPSHPVQRGKYNAIAPTDADFSRAGVWQLHVPAGALQGLSDLFLRIQYTGDVARLYEATKLLDDNFYDGVPWEIGLKRFVREHQTQSLELKIMPLRKDAPIFLPANAWPQFGVPPEIADVRSITTIPEYEVVVHWKP